jgi:hypothetical protein
MFGHEDEQDFDPHAQNVPHTTALQTTTHLDDTDIDVY